LGTWRGIWKQIRQYPLSEDSIEVIAQNVDCSVVNYIAATKTHSTDAHRIDGNWGTTPLHLFLDLYMTIPSAGSQLEYKVVILLMVLQVH